ncbi:hypothetical protein LOK49_LG06G00302 [Camellia lanceoleosa]|uniref:Uncharacterized protein n=1 Tax=Camellia lanceoleosa TaxID=1840588 RepID=A0ACC0H9U2_9ERIC|nr:hypothetical protein LOK49_LG06G00302 [Camellia lanceoleosa]
MSGEEDCNLRLWSIKSSELLFEDNFMGFVPSIVCWLKGTDLGAALVSLEIGVQSWCFVVKVTFCHYNLIIR